MAAKANEESGTKEKLRNQCHHLKERNTTLLERENNNNIFAHFIIEIIIPRLVYFINKKKINDVLFAM